jgi:hypothetical protein
VKTIILYKQGYIYIYNFGLKIQYTCGGKWGRLTPLPPH